jgi:hypothetical protein
MQNANPGACLCTKEIACQHQWHEQLKRGSAAQTDEGAEPAEQSMPAFMDDKVHIIDEQSFAMLRSGVRHE